MYGAQTKYFCRQIWLIRADPFMTSQPKKYCPFLKKSKEKNKRKIKLSQ